LARLAAEARDQLLHPRLAALGALWWPFLQAVVFADRLRLVSSAANVYNRDYFGETD
jgi:hypothetical protein